MSVDAVIRLFDLHGNFIAAMVVILATLVEITPIKVNPWSHLASWFSRILTKRIETEIAEGNKKHMEAWAVLQQDITDMKQDIRDLSEESAYNAAMTSRYRIIRAADEIQNGSVLSDEHLEQLGEDIDIYDTYCQMHPEYHNHKGQKSKQIILEHERQK